jgi:hypothetical protein
MQLLPCIMASGCIPLVSLLLQEQLGCLLLLACCCAGVLGALPKRCHGTRERLDHVQYLLAVCERA